MAKEPRESKPFALRPQQLSYHKPVGSPKYIVSPPRIEYLSLSDAAPAVSQPFNGFDVSLRKALSGTLKRLMKETRQRDLIEAAFVAGQQCFFLRLREGRSLRAMFGGKKSRSDRSKGGTTKGKNAAERWQKIQAEMDRMLLTGEVTTKEEACSKLAIIHKLETVTLKKKLRKPKVPQNGGQY